MVQTLAKSCPRLRGKWHGVAVMKGERLEAAKLFYYPPSGNPPYGVLQAPSTGCLLVRFISLHIKPALKGEVAMSVSELTEGL